MAAEIKATARSLLVAHGPEAVTLRAIARELGVTAPALYRYFENHEQLVEALVHDLLDEITATLETARDRVEGASPIQRLGETCRAFRRWGLSHPREFQLVFASVGTGPGRALHTPPGEPGDLSFGAVFLGLFVEVWTAEPFATPPEEAFPESLLLDLRAFSGAVGDVLPLGALAAYLTGWVRLYGAVTMEVFGHLGFALTDAEPMFETMLTEMRRDLTAPLAAP